jgi:hypothetical protein
MGLDNFFENLFGSGDSRETSSPTVSFKKRTPVKPPKNIGRGRYVPQDTIQEGRQLRNPNRNPNDMRSTGGIKGELSEESSDKYDPMPKGDTNKPMFRKSNQELINEKQALKDKLKNDDRPNLDQINSQLSAINKEQDKRAKKLRKDLNNEDITLTDIANKINNDDPQDTSVLTPEERAELRDILQGGRATFKGEEELGDDTIDSGNLAQQAIDKLSEEQLPTPEDFLRDRTTPEPELSSEPPEKTPVEESHPAEQNIHDDSVLDISTEFADPTTNLSLLDNTIAERLIQSYFFTIIDKLVETNFGENINSKSILDRYLVPIAQSDFQISEFLTRLNLSKKITGRLVLQDKKTKSLVLRGRAIIPLTIIIVYLFLCTKEELFKRNITDLFDFQIRKFLNVFIEDKDLIEFGIGIIRNIPIELKTAFKKQLGSDRVILDINEKNAIQQFIDSIYTEYLRRFGENLEKALYNFEGKKSLYLHSLLRTLSNSDTLFTISAGFNNIENVFKETENNPYLLIQLFSLFIAETSGENDFNNDYILSNAIIDKVIIYKSSTVANGEQLSEVNIIRNMTEDNRGTDRMEVVKDDGNVALYKFNNRYYVAFKGTNLKDMSDIKQNVLSYGSKNWYSDSKYNKVILDGIALTKEAISLSRNQNLDRPKIISYSGGTIPASMVTLRFPDLSSEMYNPLLSRNEMTDKIYEKLQKTNVRINYVDNDPISANVPFYVKKYNLRSKKYKHNKYFNPHDLKNFL